MAHGFKESDFQHGVFIPFLTAPRPAGLDWILGKPADIDQARWLVPADLLQFLREGCPLNASSFAKAVKGFDSDADFLQAFLSEALLPKIEAKANAAFVLRPRPAQRTMLHQTLCRVRELYVDESKAKINEADIRAALALSLNGEISVANAQRWLNGELDRVFPSAESLIQEMKLDERYKDVTFETLNRKDFLESVKDAFPNVDWDKAYSEFKAAGQSENKG